jgi:hypothetical protein
MSQEKILTSIMSETAIRAALDEVRLRVSDAERRRTELDRIIANGKEEERLLVRLQALRSGELGMDAEAPSQSDAVAPRAAGAGSLTVDAVVGELTNAARPLHVSELMRLLSERGIPIPGAGTQANLIAHLRRDDRIVRPSRGMYALAASGLENMPSRTGRKRRRIRKRAQAG